MMIDCLTSSKRVLDNGCGTGILKDFFDREGKIFGIDISSSMLKKAKSRGIAAVFADSEDLPFKEKSFDAVFLRGVLHHLEDPEAGIKETSRVLEDDGTFVLVEPNRSLVSIIPRLIAKLGKHFSSTHKEFSYSELTGIVEKYFEIERVYFFGYFAYVLTAFPDLVDFMKYVPFRNALSSFLLQCDKIMSEVPVLKRLGFAVMITGTKR